MRRRIVCRHQPRVDEVGALMRSEMESRARPPEWRARQPSTSVNEWVVEQNIGGVWSSLGKTFSSDDETSPAVYTEADAKLLAGGPVLLQKLVAMDLMLAQLRGTMSNATSIRQMRQVAAHPSLEVLVLDVRKLVAELGGPKDKNNGGRG
jgi:hypothetical protein